MDWKCTSMQEALIRNPRMVMLDGFSRACVPAGS